MKCIPIGNYRVGLQDSTPQVERIEEKPKSLPGCYLVLYLSGVKSSRAAPPYMVGRKISCSKAYPFLVMPQDLLRIGVTWRSRFDRSSSSFSSADFSYFFRAIQLRDRIKWQTNRDFSLAVRPSVHPCGFKMKEGNGIWKQARLKRPRLFPFGDATTPILPSFSFTIYILSCSVVWYLVDYFLLPYLWNVPLTGVLVLLPSWITGTSYLNVNKIYVHELMNHRVHWLYVYGEWLIPVGMPLSFVFGPFGTFNSDWVKNLV